MVSSDNEIAGVVVAVATVPRSPFIETTDTDVTVPAPELPELSSLTHISPLW